MWRFGDLETSRFGDLEMWRCGDVEIWRLALPGELDAKAHAEANHMWTDAELLGSLAPGAVAPGRRDLSARVRLVTEVTVDDVPPGVFCVRVRSIKEIGASPPSNEVQVVVP
jgi:hypothetical protein